MLEVGEDRYMAVANRFFELLSSLFNAAISFLRSTFSSSPPRLRSCCWCARGLLVQRVPACPSGTAPSRLPSCTLPTPSRAR